MLVLAEGHSTAAGDEQVCVALQVKNHLDPNFESMTYYPTIYFNEFWMLRDHLIPVNDTVKEVQISLDLGQMPMWKFTIFSQVEKSFEMQVDLPTCFCNAPGIRSCDLVQQAMQAAHHTCPASNSHSPHFPGDCPHYSHPA